MGDNLNDVNSNVSEKMRYKNTNRLFNVLKVVFKRIVFLISLFFKKINVTDFKICNIKVKLSKEGRSTIIFIFSLFILFFICFGFSFLTAVLFLILLLTVYFFRDPERVLPNRNNIVVSPCDGLILNIEPSHLPSELRSGDTDEYIKISVFMNIADVHVQRIPVDCKVKQIEYIKGAFINASFDKASKDNERNIVLVERENGDNICIVQIAGLVSRRIVCNLTKDEICKIGERYGMIKFGSRIELYLPRNYNIEVLPGQRLVCGETVVASF